MDESKQPAVSEEVEIALGETRLQSTWTQSPVSQAVVLFVHGSGSSRFSPRNRFVAATLQQAGTATLLFDLLTAAEEYSERMTRHLRFDIALLIERLLGATRWIAGKEAFAGQPIGYFGASTGAAAALVVAAQLEKTGQPRIGAVVARGGRPDLAGAALSQVHTPTLLIVGANDIPVIELNRQAWAQLAGVKEMKIVPRASHLFEEPGTLEEVVRLATAWFRRYLLASEEPI